MYIGLLDEQALSQHICTYVYIHTLTPQSYFSLWIYQIMKEAGRKI